MDSLTELYNEISEEEIYEPRPRKPDKKEPVTVAEFREWMRHITQRPIKLICIFTAHWKLDWYQQLYSEVKYERDYKKHAMIINYWMKKTRPQ